MTNSETLENEFREYIKGCVLSRRPTNKADFIIGKNAAESYICFVKPDKLFSYNPTKWAQLNSSYKCNGIHINNLFKFFVWCEVSKSFTRSII